MAKIEIELNDELEARLKRVAYKVALTPPETAKLLLAQQLASERSIDWVALINKAREVFSRLI